MTDARRDQNHVPVALGVSSTDSTTTLPLTIDPVTGRLRTDSSGGGGSPGGSDTQVQYNNAGSFGGITGATTNGTTLTLVAPVLGTPASGTLTNTTGFPVANLAGAGAGVLTFLATPSSANLASAVTDETGTGALVFANTPTLVTPLLGTPTSGTLTNCTGLPISTGVSGLAAGIATFLATPSSANLASAVTDETGTGALVFGTSPTFTTQITTPKIIGGSGTTGTQLTFQTTTGNGTTDQMVFVGGNNGATTFATLAANVLNLGTSAALTTGTIELGNSSDTTISRSAAGAIAVEGVVVPTISSTNTLTNKRITKRVGTTTSSATPTINTDNVDYYSLTAQTADITSFTTNLSGTPTDGQTLWISITGTAARAITWGTSFEASTVALPTTTVSTNRLDVGFVWNAATSKWRCVASC